LVRALDELSSKFVYSQQPSLLGFYSGMLLCLFFFLFCLTSLLNEMFCLDSCFGWIINGIVTCFVNSGIVTYLWVNPVQCFTFLGRGGGIRSFISLSKKADQVFRLTLDQIPLRLGDSGALCSQKKKKSPLFIFARCENELFIVFYNDDSILS
jgi:hypothetical protein